MPVRCGGVRAPVGGGNRSGRFRRDGLSVGMGSIRDVMAAMLFLRGRIG
jgi:hypothetical protein